jgi:hypothetical protein
MKRRTVWLVVLILAVLGLAGALPSYSRIRVQGHGVDVDIERTGFGPQKIRVETKDVKAESSAR